MPLARAVWLLYQREMRSALRERTIVVNSILLPVLLYPFTLWAMFTGLTFVQGQTAEMVPRVALVGLPPEHAPLRRDLELRDRARVRTDLAVAEAERRVVKGEVDVLLEVTPPRQGDGGLAGNFEARLVADESKERSKAARERVVAALDRYREAWLAREAARRGLDAAAWQVFTIAPRNVASGRQLGAFLLGLMLPTFFVVMVALGCFYPAIDATAGERERSTWETLLTLAVPRSSVVIAKYLVVATFGFAAGLLNLGAMLLTMEPLLKPLFRRGGGTLEFTVPLSAAPLLVLCALLLAAFVAGGMMLLASGARSFKDGQSMVMPFYLLVLLPVMFLQIPGLGLSTRLALLPVVNVTLVVREAISGVFQWPLIGLTVLVTGGLVAAELALASVILRFEDVVLGSYAGSLGALLRHRVFRRSA